MVHADLEAAHQRDGAGRQVVREGHRARGDQRAGRGMREVAVRERAAVPDDLEREDVVTVEEGETLRVKQAAGREDGGRAAEPDEGSGGGEGGDAAGKKVLEDLGAEFGWEGQEPARRRGDGRRYGFGGRRGLR